MPGVMGPELSSESLDAIRALASVLDDSSALKALDAGYEQVYASNKSPRDDMILLSRPHPSGVCEFLCIGTAPVEVHAMFDTIADATNRPSWDPYCTEHRLLCTFPSPAGTSHTLNYWVSKYPSPLRKRDYVYERITEAVPHNLGKKPSSYFVATTAVKSQVVPEDSKIIRVVDSQTAYCLREGPTHEGQPSCRFIYNGFDDPRGYIPKPIINFFATKGVPSILQSMYRACTERKDRI